MPDMLKFDSPKNQSSIIKVIGVGGGGSNAVNHMFRQGIKGVDFIICNTDAQAMESSMIPNRIQLGANLTGGLGAGAAPSVGRNAALENAEVKVAIRGFFDRMRQIGGLGIQGGAGNTITQPGITMAGCAICSIQVLAGGYGISLTGQGVRQAGIF